MFPDLEQCEAIGETLEDAIENANEAARNWTIRWNLRRRILSCPMCPISKILRPKKEIL